jgi:hypothetical protein
MSDPRALMPVDHFIRLHSCVRLKVGLNVWNLEDCFSTQRYIRSNRLRDAIVDRWGAKFRAGQTAYEESLKEEK